MNISIPSYAIGAILFLVGQTTAAIWWASSLSAEVERIAQVQGTAIPELQAEAKQCGLEIHNLKKLTSDHDKMGETIKGLDVVRYKVDNLVVELDDLQEWISDSFDDINDKSREIARQHAQIFDMLRAGGPNSAPIMQQSQSKYGYD